MAGLQAQRRCFGRAMTIKRSALNDAPVSRFAVIASADAAAEVIEKFAKNIEMIVPLFRLTVDRAQHCNERFH
jgi:ABC-type phosphate transport system ATPase subunit